MLTSSDSRPEPGSQAAVHTTLIFLAIVVLIFRLYTWGSPLLPNASWKPPDSEHPLIRILVLLSASVALPYFLVSTTGPLLQAWYSRRCSGTPYRLYALSNAGSLIALLSYPVVAEPFLPLRIQAQLWTGGFLLFGLACSSVAWLTAGRGAVVQKDLAGSSVQYKTPKVSWRRKMMWLALAAAGSLSLLATTNRICQDVAVVPLLWVLPLSLYLLSFIACFSSETWYSRTLWSVGLGLAILLVCFALYHSDSSVGLQIVIYCFALFASCMVCHGELVRLQPPKEQLTSFYLYVAAGGAVGGFFVSILAPLVFKGFWEFHLSTWLCCVLFCFVLLRDATSWIYMPRPLLLGFSMLVVFAGPGLAAFGARPLACLLASLLVAALVIFLFSGGPAPISGPGRRRAALFSVSFTAVVLALTLAYPPYALAYRSIMSRRNFYGALSVVSDMFEGHPRRVLRHGKITHGFQFSEEVERRLPTSYYRPESGIGLVLTNLPGRASGRVLRIGVIGLGVGTIAAYGIPGDQIRFYEINPAVIQIASSGPEQIFTFLSDSRAKVTVIPGDARISLEREFQEKRTQDFDVLVIDAFSGDSIPVHLLTKEAFVLYLQHLSKPNGLLAFHISNNAIDLRPVVARLAAESGMSAWLAQSNAPYMSAWIIVGSPNRDGPMPGVEHMTRITSNPHFPLWTDDYSNVFQILRW